MKAAYYEKYGSADVLEIRDVARPEIDDNEVLVQVSAADVSTADWRLRASDFPLYAWLPARLMFGLFAPKNKVPGMAFAGRIVAKGRDVSQFKGGDRVFGFAQSGAQAEYVKIAVDKAIAHLPDGVGYAQGAAVPFGALSALVFLRDYADIQPGQRVLINGATGGVGVFAVQLAKYFGAEVTGVAGPEGQQLMYDLGADHVIDYQAGDFTQMGGCYDLIFDTVGTTSFRTSKSVLAPQGTYLPIDFAMREIIQSLLSARSKGQRVMVGISGDIQADLQFLAELLAQGDIQAVVDSQYPLEQIAQAHRKVETRHKRGSVVVMIRDGSIAMLGAA